MKNSDSGEDKICAGLSSHCFDGILSNMKSKNTSEDKSKVTAESGKKSEFKGNKNRLKKIPSLRRTFSSFRIVDLIGHERNARINSTNEQNFEITPAAASLDETEINNNQNRICLSCRNCFEGVLRCCRIWPPEPGQPTVPPTVPPTKPPTKPP